jgi:hypothetical protein
MFRALVYSAILTAMLAASLVAQRPMGRAATPKAAGPPGAANNKKGNKGNRNIVDKWNRMTPDEREKAFAKLPPDKREKIERQLNQYNHLTPQQRRQLQTFNQLPPEKQNQARRLYRQFNEFPQARRGMLSQEFENLRGMSEADRRARLTSDEFRGKYDPREQKFLGGLSGLLSPPE